MTTDVLSMLLKFPPSYVTTFSLPLATIFLETPLTREQLLPAVANGTRVGDWTISFDAKYDRLNYVRNKPLARPATPTPPRGVPPAAAPVVIDPVAVAKKAREYQDAEMEAGREISTTEAVHHVLHGK